MSGLSSDERTVIQTLLELNFSIRGVARFLNRSPATISVEIRQVTPYNAKQAHQLALAKRHIRGRHSTLTADIAVFLNQHIGVLKWSPETAAHVLDIPFKNIYNWINHGLLKVKCSDLPDKGIRQKRQADGRRQVFIHGRSIESRPASVTTRQEFGHFEGLKIVIVGDIIHSRVAHSNFEIMQRLGMEVYTSGPREFEEPGYNYVDFDSILPEVDIVMLLRVQHERHQNLMKLSKEEYHKLYGLNQERVNKMKERAIIMHPAPFNRNVEIADDIVECDKSRIFKQMKNGVFVRMALLNKVLNND